MGAPLAILLMAIAVPIVLYQTGAVLVSTLRNVICADPKFAIRAFASGAISTTVGYLKTGVVTIEIVLYGFLGCLVYALALLIKFNGK